MNKLDYTAKWAVGILTIISVALIVGGFFVPPLGVIDGSVLTAVGEIFAFAALWVVAHALFVHGANIDLKKGDTTIHIDTDNENETNT